MLQLALRFGSSFSILLVVSAAQAQITLLHEFGSIADDGGLPISRMTQVGSTLYGTTLFGGAINQGALFSIGTDGSGYDVEYDFFTSHSGMQPQGDLAIGGSTVYGVTEFGGASPFIGTVYSVGVDGSTPTILHEFTGGADDGSRPAGGVVQIGSTLYGTTITGGDDDAGTIFSVGTDGTGFTLLHEFDYTEGLSPSGGLVHAGGKFYGTTQGGGQEDYGLIYSIDTNGSNYTVLHEFVEDPNGYRPNGAFPGEIIVDGTTIYGVTLEGGADEAGAVYKIDTNGTGFSLLHSFDEDPNFNYPEGGFPSDALAISGSTLVGVTPFGGAADSGVVFSLGTDGSGFQVLHEFSGGPDDGSVPEAGVIIDGSTIFGTTRHGGDFGSGTIYSLPFSGGGPSFREADFNTDTFVDNVDLGIWEAAYNLTDAGDADSDSNSSGLDFLIWQQQFGLPPLLSATVQAVPEPGSALLICCAALCVGGARRRR